MIRRTKLTRRAAPDAARQIRYSEPPLFAGAVPLNPSLHNALIWQAPTDLRFAEALQSVPIALSEALPAAAFLPLALAPGRVPQPMVMLAKTGAAQSPFMRDGRLIGRYLPAILRFYPFLPMRDPENMRPVVAAHITGNCVRTGHADEGWAQVFSATGALAPEAAQRVQAMASWQAQRDQALAAAQALRSAGLLRPAPLAGDGWQTVDPATLPALSEPTLARLNAAGALALAYALETSAMHMPNLEAAQAPSHRDDVSAGESFLAALSAAEDTPDTPMFWPDIGEADQYADLLPTDEKRSF